MYSMIRSYLHRGLWDPLRAGGRHALWCRRSCRGLCLLILWTTVTFSSVCCEDVAAAVPLGAPPARPTIVWAWMGGLTHDGVRLSLKAMLAPPISEGIGADVRVSVVPACTVEGNQPSVLHRQGRECGAELASSVVDAHLPAAHQRLGELGDRAREPHAVQGIVNLKDLSPGTLYQWEVTHIAGVQQPEPRTEPAAGSFRTLSAGPGSAFSFSFVFSSCAATGSNHEVFDFIRERHPDFVLVTGDLFYGDVAEGGTQGAAKYDEALDSTLTAPRQAALWAHVPIVWTWDDHDYGDNNSDGTHPGRDAIARVYRARVPHFPLNITNGIAIHHSFTVGRTRFVVMDQRSQRTPNRTPDGPSKTVLGQQQLSWLRDELQPAQAFVFLVSSMPWLDDTEKWGWFPTERKAIAAVARSSGLAPERMLMLCGDMHAVAYDDGTHVIGEFPVAHAAALDAPPSVKGGPYSHGVFADDRGQYGAVDVVDDGQTVCTRFSGWQVASGSDRELLRVDSCGGRSTPRKVYYPPPIWLRRLTKWWALSGRFYLLPFGGVLLLGILAAVVCCVLNRLGVPPKETEQRATPRCIGKDKES